MSVIFVVLWKWFSHQRFERTSRRSARETNNRKVWHNWVSQSPASLYNYFKLHAFRCSRAGKKIEAAMDCSGITVEVDEAGACLDANFPVFFFVREVLNIRFERVWHWRSSSKGNVSVFNGSSRLKCKINTFFKVMFKYSSWFSFVLKICV